MRSVVSRLRNRQKRGNDQSIFLLLAVFLWQSLKSSLKLQELRDDCNNLTSEFPNGVSSIILKENATKWQVFTQLGYHGAKVSLDPGRRYKNLDDMGLGNTVKSIRRFVPEKVKFL